ncbi:MAG: hypothetical protein ACOYMR_11585 [Ilumatobacteraceae bacterium]
MAEHDDELDRRIHDLLGAAQADAPEPDRTTMVVTNGVPSAQGRRWPVYVGLAAAAAVVLFVVGMATRTTKDENSIVPVTDPTEATTPDAATSTSPTASTTPNTEVDPATCGRTSSYPFQETGSIHTVAPVDLPVHVTIEAPTTVCIGGTALAEVTLRNDGTAAVTIDRTQLVISSGADKWPVGGIAPIELEPQLETTLQVPIAAPTIRPGEYSLFLYGFDGYTSVTLAGPTVCGGGQLRTEVVLSDGAGQRRYTVTRATNQDDVPCVLPPLTGVEGLTADGSAEPIQLQSDGGTGLPSQTLLRNFVLEPGEQADLYVTTGSFCLDGTVQPKIYPRVRAQLGFNLQGDSDAFVDLAADVDVACGLWVSGWAEPTAQ